MNVPKLRFKDDDGREFPGWTLTELKHLAAINPKSNKLPDEFIYIDLESVEKGLLLKEDLLKLNDAPSRAQRLLRQNDILFQMVRPYQRNNLFFNKAGNYVASTGYAQIRAHQVPKFLYYCLHLDEFVTEVMNRCTGTSYPAINSDALSTIELKQPESKYEQVKIANFLTAVDEKIHLLKQKLDLLTQYKKGIMQKIFSQELRFKDDDGGDFPEWGHVELGEVCKPQQWRTIAASELTEFGYPAYGANGKIGFYSEYNHENETVAVTCRGATCGEVSLIPPQSYITGNAMSLDDIDPNENNLHYVYYALVFRGFRDVISGSAQPQIVGSAIRKVNLAKPTLKEQTKIANFLSAIDDKINQTQAELDAVKQYKQGLLQQMFV